ncbi:MAG: TrkH family potassium uptake protein [Peptoniphilaceae bacterium]
MKSKIKSLISRYIKNPPLLLGISFGLVILIGTLLLNLPIASVNKESVGFINALFTSSSATCVTGLTVVNTANHWSLFGKIVILVLIQIGGLGTMVMFSMIAVIFKMKIGLKQRLLIKEQLNTSTLSGLVKLSKYVITITFIIEAIGALLFSTVFIPQYGIKIGVWYSVFHAISAFCNAGFDIFGNSIVGYNTNILINLTVIVLIILGGLGFTVYMDIYRHRRFNNYNVHTKMVLIMTVILLVIGTLSFFLIEYSNPSTIGNYSLRDKFLMSLFQSTTTRTAGFNSINISKMQDSSALIMIILMFIGGASASTAGGIKVSTFGVLLFSALSVVRGDRKIVFAKRNIPISTVLKALTILFICMGLVLFVALGLSIVESGRFTFLDILFESVSAFGTVGITRGITDSLHDASKIILSLTMFMGRVGPTTLAVGIMKKRKVSNIKYAEGNIIVG